MSNLNQIKTPWVVLSGIRLQRVGYSILGGLIYSVVSSLIIINSEDSDFVNGFMVLSFSIYLILSLLIVNNLIKSGEFLIKSIPDFHNGRDLVKGVQKNGLWDGPYEEYYENGLLGIKGTYKDGERDGFFEIYYRKGQLRLNATYKDGVLDGPFEEYDKSGKLSKKGIYENGKFIKN